MRRHIIESKPSPVPRTNPILTAMESLLFFEVKKNNHILFWFGVEHSRDEKHPQFQELKDKWERFLKDTRSPLIVAERKGDETYTSELRSIQDGGEVGLMTFLAAKIAAPMKCFEPNRHNEMNYLAGLFGKESVEYYYFARTVAQWHRLVRDEKVEEYVLPFLKRDKDASNWDDFDFSISHMERIHMNLFGGRLDFDDKEFFLKIENPNREDNPLRDVVRASGAYREKSIIEGVKSAWKDHDIFMVYGKDHQEAQQAGLSN